ncbi:hypothetical protein [Planktothrix tepida]|nr:hypothetical protein [Planktothrix tepida]
MNDEDYLGITALALSTLAELMVDSIDPKDVRPVLMEVLVNASLKWGTDTNSTKEDFLIEVKKSIDEVRAWREKYKSICADSN